MLTSYILDTPKPVIETEKVYTFGSLFSGIGGIDLGFERTGRLRCAWQCEIDDYCRRVLAKHWPTVQRFGDIRGVRGCDLPPVDVLAGGFPCQDISEAGNRAGITGERSGLWSEYARLVREVRPRVVVVENVAALLRRGVDRVLGDLAESGFDAQWDCIPAAAVGAPHLRDRVFIVAYSRHEQLSRREADSEGGEGAAFGKPAPCSGTVADSAGCGTPRKSESHQNARVGLAGGRQGFSGRLPVSYVADTDCKPSFRFAVPWNQCDFWTTEPAVGRVVDGVPSRVDRLKGLGNAVVPQVAELVGRRVVSILRAMDAATPASPSPVPVRATEEIS